MEKDVLHIINGKKVESISGKKFQTINPANGSAIANVAFAENEDVNLAVDNSYNTFVSGNWSKMSPTDRSRCMRRVADIIEKRADELALLETKDNGKPLSNSLNDILGAASIYHYFSQLTEYKNGSVYPEKPGYFTFTKREPYGVVAAIAPWNYPFVNAVSKSAPALAVGNCVVIKMAEETPITTTEFGLICLEAGIPPGVVNIIHGDGPTTGASLATNKKIEKITFTGSTEVGKKILKSTADQIKSVHLELGGKTPNIVFEDADIDNAVSGSVFTSFFNSGQICTTGSRLLIQDTIADEFVDKLINKTKKIILGDPFDKNTNMGPLITEKQLCKVKKFINSGINSSAKLIIGGNSPQIKGFEKGFFLNPTIFTNVHPDIKIAQEEIFGPVLSIISFSNEEEAIKIANNTIYGLAATIWTNDLSRTLRMSEKLSAGIIWTNCPNYLKFNVPYEGHKFSGDGEDLGTESLRTFTKLKVNYINYGNNKISWV